MARVLASCGLVLNAIGGILLAVEAIRLHNLIQFRDRALPALKLAFESPLLLDGSASSGERERNAKRGFGMRTWLYTGFHLFSAAAVLATVETLRLWSGLGPDEFLGSWVWDWQSGWRWAVLVFAVVLGLQLPFTVGCWVHRTFERFLDVFVALLVVIEQGTPTGGTGIAGALFFLGGVILQLVVVWI